MWYFFRVAQLYWYQYSLECFVHYRYQEKKLTSPVFLFHIILMDDHHTQKRKHTYKNDCLTLECPSVKA